MSELLQTYWPLLVAALVVGLVVAWYVFSASRRTRVTGTSRDVLDEGAAPAERNKALIDSAPAATPMQPPTGIAPRPQTGAAPAASPPAPAPTTPAPAPAPAPTATDADDLTRIKGLGPKLSATLNALGVTRFEQIAAWDDAEIDRIDSQLGRFQGRIRRDDWVGQAALLAGGDETGFATRYGKLT